MTRQTPRAPASTGPITAPPPHRETDEAIRARCREAFAATQARWGHYRPRPQVTLPDAAQIALWDSSL